MPQRVSWYGNQDELLQLTAVVGHNCACARDSSAWTRPTCAAHRMLWQDQRALNGLLFARHIADRLLREEFSVSQPASEAGWALTTQVTTAYCRRREHRCISMLPGLVILVFAIGLLCAEDMCFVLGAMRGCWIQPVGWQCLAWADSNLTLGWAILGLLLMVCGASLSGLAFFTRRLSVHSRPAAFSSAALSNAPTLHA